jgi:hypothetical protein
MATGRQTRTLKPDQIERLAKFKVASHEDAPHGYSYAGLRSAMAASFGWQTLKKALAGLPVWELHYMYIAQWIERYLPAAPAAAVVNDESNTQETSTDGTLRRQR